MRLVVGRLLAVGSGHLLRRPVDGDDAVGDAAEDVQVRAVEGGSANDASLGLGGAVFAAASGDGGEDLAGEAVWRR